MMVKYPTILAPGFVIAFEMMKGLDEIVLMGDYQKAQKQILAAFATCNIYGSSKPEDQYPLLKINRFFSRWTIYLCKNPLNQFYSVEKLINKPTAMSLEETSLASKWFIIILFLDFFPLLKRFLQSFFTGCFQGRNSS